MFNLPSMLFILFTGVVNDVGNSTSCVSVVFFLKLFLNNFILNLDLTTTYTCHAWWLFAPLIQLHLSFDTIWKFHSLICHGAISRKSCSTGNNWFIRSRHETCNKQNTYQIKHTRTYRDHPMAWIDGVRTCVTLLFVTSFLQLLSEI